VVLAVALTVLVGWALGIRILTSGLPHLTTMKVNTALCLGALAVAVLRPSRAVVRGSAGLVLAVTGLTLVEILTGTDLGIDELVVPDRTAKPGIAPGQMAPATAVSLIALAVSVLLLDRGRNRWAQALLALPVLTATMTLFGYLFGVEQLYRVTTLSGVAIHSAAAWGLLAIAVAARIPGGLLTWVARGSGPGSAIVRGTVPVVTGGLVAVGLLRDALAGAGVIGDRFGTAMVVLTGGLIAVTVTVLTARPLDKVYRARLRADQSLRDLNASLVKGRDAAWRRAEDLAAELGRERSRFQSAIANTEDLVWTVETTGGSLVPVYFSPNAVRIMGAPLPADAEVQVEFGRRVDPADRPLLEGFADDVVRGVPSEIEVRVHGLDGQLRWVWLRGSPRVEGERTFFDGIATNTTERRALADQRELLLGQARLQVQRLSELAAARDEFTTVAGHELRTPVAVIVGYCEMLAEPDLAPAVRDQAIEAIGRRALQLQELVDGVFDLARLDSGAFHLAPEPLDLAEYVVAVLGDYEPVAAAAGVEVRNRVESAEVLADRNSLRLVVDNVLANAIKYTPVGGHVTVTVRQVGGQVVLEVADDGMGVSDEELPRIFERMFRGTNARESRIPGTGLGLALTKELVEAVGGQVSARANVPHGLVLTITLPELSADPPDAAPSASGASWESSEPSGRP
jgi:signal transduction histidine kinase